MVIDTNIVLRYLLRDDLSGFKKASEIMESGELVEATYAVISESVYVMRGKLYNKTKHQVVGALGTLLEQPNVVDLSGLAEHYLRLYERTNIDLTDCYLIAYAIANKTPLKTFDKKMQRVYETEKTRHSSTRQ